MSKYYIHIVVLEDCYYSNAAIKLLENNNNVIVTKVNYKNKENYKTKYIDTFPQIYLKHNIKKGSFLVGGYDELKNMFELFHNNNEQTINKQIDNFINKNGNKNENNKKYYWSNKSLSIFIKLINQTN